MAMNAKARLAAIGRRVRETSAETKELGSMGVAALGIGLAQRSGALDAIPRPFGLPRTAILAVAGHFAGKGMPSARPYAHGLRNAAASIALYEWGRTLDIAQVAGTSDATRERIERAERRMQAQRLAERNGAGVDAELRDLERASA